MVRIHWQGQALIVRRIVLGRPTVEGGSGEALRRIAGRGDLVVAAEATEPQEGDFWVGCQPEKGWGEIDFQRIGWANGPETALALAILRGAAKAEEFVEAPVVANLARDAHQNHDEPATPSAGNWHFTGGPLS
jgi:hypothetical protein